MTDALASPIEILRPDFPRGRFRAVLFDFDGTISLIRRDWPGVMIPMMVDVLVEAGAGETREELRSHVEEFVMRLNGKQTIYQMIQLADEVRLRGGVPRDPLEYKRQYHELLYRDVGQRVQALKGGRIPQEELTVPGTHALLAALAQRGLELYLASGTDLHYVRDEAQALGVADYFGPRVYGALDDYKNFSKQMIIDRIIAETGVAGDELLAFGDGYVEIEETRRVGGVAVGVASEEVHRHGVNQWKRGRLVRAGADLIVADYRNLPELLLTLGL